ncbi:MAG: hypothetical protein PUE95_12655 [Lachnospiraceae bacterium]|nr:hypothetical protein [Lachnospiraceae bacterium]
MGNFVNFSNHPSACWGEEQLKVAKQQYGDIIDISFPVLDPCMDEETIAKIGDECLDSILKWSPRAVMCQGEFTLTFYVVNRLINKGITCVSACSERSSVEMMQEDGSVRKESLFLFRGFRKYIL